MSRMHACGQTCLLCASAVGVPEKKGEEWNLYEDEEDIYLARLHY